MKSPVIYVKNIPITYDIDTINQLFSAYGKIAKVSYPIDTKTKDAKGYAFVMFEKLDAAERALEKNGDEIEGENLIVEYSKEQTIRDASKTKSNKNRIKKEKKDASI